MALAAAMAPNVVRVVDERREEVERADDRQVVAQAVDGGIIGCVEADEQRIRGRLARVACTSAKAPRPASASASTSAPSLAAQPPQVVCSVSGSALGRSASRGRRGHGRPMIRVARRRLPSEPSGPAASTGDPGGTEEAMPRWRASDADDTGRDDLAALPPDRREAIAARARRHPRQPASWLRGGHAVRDDRLLTCPSSASPTRTTASRSASPRLASQKNYMSLYLNTVYGDPETDRWFRERYAACGQEARHGQVVCPLPQARRPATRPDRRDDRPDACRSVRRAATRPSAARRARPASPRADPRLGTA